MPTIGVQVAIIRDGKIMLTRREDFQVWGLPGGHVLSRESVYEAAQREAGQEAGVQVALTGLVGVYSQPGWRDGGAHAVVFRGEIAAGVVPQPQPGETIDVAFFDADSLPEDLIWWHRQRILDALNGVSGVVWEQETRWPFADDETIQDARRHGVDEDASWPDIFEKYFGSRGDQTRHL